MGTASGEPGGERLEGSGDLAMPRCLERKDVGGGSHGALSLHGPGFQRLPLWSPELPGLLGSLLHLPNACWEPGLGLPGHRRNDSKEGSHGPLLRGWST